MDIYSEKRTLLTAKPIKNKTIIRNILNYIGENSQRDLILVKLILIAGLRLEDILKLTIDDVYNKDVIHIKETKTGKIRRINNLKEILGDYVINRKRHEYLISSKRDGTKLKRQYVYHLLRRYGGELRKNISYITLRKTFMYWIYKETKDLMLIHELMGCSNIEVVKEYLDLADEYKCNF